MQKDSYSEIGILLRRAREDQKLNLEQVSHLLHIRVRYLAALEHGALEDIPGLTYTRGYLLSYAGFLNLDKDEILRRFEDVEAMLGRRGFYFPQVFSKEKSAHPMFIWGGLLAAVLTYTVWLSMFHPQGSILSVVEPFPEEDKKVTISAVSMQDVACLQPQAVLYPPCTAAGNAGQVPLPLPRQMVSVMELAEK